MLSTYAISNLSIYWVQLREGSGGSPIRELVTPVDARTQNTIVTEV